MKLDLIYSNKKKMQKRRFSLPLIFFYSYAAHFMFCFLHRKVNFFLKKLIHHVPCINLPIHKSFTKTSAVMLKSSVPSIAFSRNLSQYSSRFRLVNQLQTSSTVHAINFFTAAYQRESRFKFSINE